MNKTQLIGQATPEQIEEWKTKYGKLFAIIIDGHIAYLKKPDRKTLGYASTVGAKDPIKFNEVVLNNCFIGGSEAIKTDDDLFFGASSKLVDIIQVKEAELVNL
ncbi:MAG: hypothetical protein WCR72_15255 [Bacteroidota bacterium]